MNEMTVAQAQDAMGALTGDPAKVARLIEASLNAEAALQMLGCRLPKKRTGFLPVGVQTLVQIDELLATMPEEVALVKAATAFGCDWCGMPATTGAGDDGWICETCYRKATQ